MSRLWSFLQYHNAVPIALFVIFGATGATFAASPEVREAVLSAEEIVQSVDNTYIVSADLASRDFGLVVTKIEEDEEYYYVSYTYRTIAIVDYVWQESDIKRQMKVSKKELLGKDLGLFIAKQVGEEMRAEMAFLGEVQAKEREKGAVTRVVTTMYSGLIGKMLDPKEEVFAGYAPVVAETLSDTSSSAAAAALAGSGEVHLALPPILSPGEIERLVSDAVTRALVGPITPVGSSVAGEASGEGAPQGSGSLPKIAGGENGAPRIVIMGDNPTRIAVGDSYTDLGALVSDDKDDGLVAITFVDGEHVNAVHLDTSTTTMYEIKYGAVDSGDKATEVTPFVEVSEPASTPPAGSSS